MRTTWTFHSAGQILFGRESVRQLGHVARGLGAKRALVITDPALVAAGVADRATNALAGQGIEVRRFDGGVPEPSFGTVLSCEAQARGFQPDVLVGVGGGSNMDLAKITAVLLRHGQHPRDYVGDSLVPGPVVPVIAVPTTAGTGSEVSAAAVLTDTERRAKVGVLSNHLRPSAAVVDPMLTLSCPPDVTADSGIDALTHAIEAYTAVDNAEFPLPPGERTIYQGRHPLGEILAERAIQLIARHLPTAVRNGRDLEAREGMHLGALLAGLAFSNVGVALVHALEYPLGSAVRSSHGRGNGLLLPYVMEFNKSARLQSFVRIAELMGQQTTGLSLQGAADVAIESVRNLRRQIGIPDRLSAIGVREGQLRGFAETAIGIQRILRVNPRPVTVDDLEGILRAAY